MDPEDCVVPKSMQKSARQSKGEKGSDARQRPRSKKNLRADYSSYLGFQMKQPQPALAAPLRPKRKPASARNVTLSPYFRFALKFPADYSQFHLDPSLPVDWDSILHVTKLTDNEFACPICLEDTLTAPRVSSCGHCFCYPCILQYLAHDEQRDKRCPVCFDTVRAAGLKPVEVRKTTAISEGYIATFRLVRRQKGALSLYACGQSVTGHVYQRLPDARSPDAVYNRLCVAFNPRGVWEEHIAQLERARAVQDPGACSKALELTVSELERLPVPGLVRVPPYDASCSCCKTIHPLTLNVLDAQVCPLHGKDTEEQFYDCRLTPVSAEPARDEDAYFYFYQLADGQPYFLHPLTNRCLARQFGSWSALPDTLTAPVLQVEDAVMNDYMRGKLK